MIKILGAIIGDIIGSPYEFYNTKDLNFDLFQVRSRPTDDTIMTLAVADWLVEDPTHSPEFLIEGMVLLGKQYPRAGYGKRFLDWLFLDNQHKPYGSYGNGSAMRVSPIGLYAGSLEEVLYLSKVSAEVSHSHPEGIKGAQAIASCMWLLRNGSTKDQIKEYIINTLGYKLPRLSEIRDTYSFDETCQGSVPIALESFLESTDFENSIRLAVSVGGDSDTIACMTGSLSSCYYSIPENIASECYSRLDDIQKGVMENFFNKI